MRRGLAGAACTAVAFAFALTARAQDPPAPSDSATSTPTPTPTPTSTPTATPTATATPSGSREPLEVRVIGNKPDSLQRVPGSGTVITRQEIERAAPYDVAEMLRRVPGIQVRQEVGGGQRLDISVRGLEGGRSRRVLVLEDGIPVAINPYAEPDLYYAPPIERMRGIEVVKGSGSILFGPQTIGGVVNFLTLAPSDTPHAAVDFEGGSPRYVRGLVTYGDSFGGARYVVQAFHKRGDGLRAEAFNSTDVFAKLAFDTSSKGEATVKVGFHDDSADSDDVGLTRGMYAADPRRTTLAPNDHLYLRRYEASLIHELRFDDKTKLRTLIYGYITNRIWRRQEYLRCGGADGVAGCEALAPGGAFDRIVGDTSLPNGAILFERSDFVLDREYQVAGIEPRLEHRVTTGGVEHTIDLGARVLGESAHYQQRTGADVLSYAGTLDSDERHRNIAFAAYVQDRMAFRDNLLVTPGLRFEHANFHRLVSRRNDADVSDAFDLAVNGVMPGIGFIYGTRSAHVFSGLHVGWAPPRFNATVSAKGDPSLLSPESSLNYEIGTRVTKKWLRAEATGFLSEFQNQVVVNTSPGALTQEQDGGHTQHIGVEAGVTWSVGKLLDIAPLIDVGARYTFARATFAGGPTAGNLLPYAPLHSFNANVDVEHPSGFGGQIAYTHVSSQFTDILNTVAEEVTGRIGIIPSRNVIDVGAHYRHRATGLSVRLVVKNALDDVYIIARRPEGIFASGFRQVLLGVRWDWEGVKNEAQ